MEKNTTKIGFIGQGWIGKHYADDFENRGYNVVRYALDEPHVNNGDYIAECDIVFIAVPTPTTPEGFDSSILKKVIKKVGKGKIAVIKSTLALGVTEEIQKENPDIFVFHSPEFLSEATAALDAANPQRNIIGTPVDDENHIIRAKFILTVLPRAKFELICSASEAELIKYGGNNYFYLKVVYINMLYDLAKRAGADWNIIRKAMINDPRIGQSHMTPLHKSGTPGGDVLQVKSEDEGYAGRGAGGHCFIKDFAAFIEMYERYVGDEAGVKALKGMENKNLDLLVKSGKDYDLLHGVYGNKMNFPVKSDKTNIHLCPNKRVLVTGGAGFIGSYLSRYLLDKGYDVVAIDNFNNYYPRKAKEFNLDLIRQFSGQKTEYFTEENLAPILDKITEYSGLQPRGKGKYEFIECDIRDRNGLRNIFQNERFDAIVHLAAMAGVPYSLENPRLYQEVNVGGTDNLLKLCQEFNVKRFVFGSSSSVYGGRTNIPFKETDNVSTPISYYAATKKMSEVDCYTHHYLSNLSVVVARIFGPIHGPLQRPFGMAAQRFIRQIYRGEPMTIYGDGMMGRDSTYIDDIVDGLYRCICADCEFEIVNIGTGRAVTVIDLARMVRDMFGRGGIVHIDKPATEVPITFADTEKAKTFLGYEPMFDFQEGLRRQFEIFNMMPDWYKDIEG